MFIFSLNVFDVIPSSSFLAILHSGPRRELHEAKDPPALPSRVESIFNRSRKVSTVPVSPMALVENEISDPPRTISSESEVIARRAGSLRLQD
ncbi:hypothetical protein Cni_G17547 [Canna indica]|uniref:Uncharacterized protein n=1 Tax=Canna indica TaxID=4628 RepID=A0AAQ3KHW4_9LILI|nr:hypothetical protein Cni_G17547 [Canna indica]